MKLGNLNVSCKVVGEDEQPWNPHAVVYKYRVTVSLGKARYSSDAWGSAHDYERGKHDCDSISVMVVDELLSANADPDEFLTMVMGEASGREALKRAKSAEKVIKAAKKFSYDELVKAINEAEENGLR